MFKKTILNENGAVVSVLLIILLSLLITVGIYSTEHIRTIHSVDVDLQQALRDAVRTATYCVNVESQANREPMIEAEHAHEVFRFNLAKNLMLNPNTLEPLESSGLTEPPYYEFIVYNGSDKYGVIPLIKYTSNNPMGISLSYNELNPFPQTFSISDSIQVGQGLGVIDTELDRPGCIAYVSSGMKPIIVDEKAGARWAAAKIVRR